MNTPPSRPRNHYALTSMVVGEMARAGIYVTGSVRDIAVDIANGITQEALDTNANAAVAKAVRIHINRTLSTN